MLRTRFALCSSRVIRDADENRISVIDLLEDITVPAFPVVIPRLSLIWSVSREPGDAENYTGNVVLRMNEQVLMETPVEINFQGASVTRATAVIGGLALPLPGQFSVVWSIPEILEARYDAVVSSQPHLAIVDGPAGQMGMLT